MGRVEEINLGLLAILGAATGAAVGGAGTRGGRTEGGGAGGLDVRPADVSSPAGGTPPTASVEAISVIGVAPSPGLAIFLFGALGELIFKFGITGRWEDERSGCLVATEFFSCRRAFRGSGRGSGSESGIAGVVTTAGIAEAAATGWACSTATGCAGVWVWAATCAAASGVASAGLGAVFAAGGTGVDG